MSIHIPENFYRQTITRAVTLVGATNIYVSAHPTPSEGFIAISPASTTLREIVYYTVKGTDGNGTYLTVTLANRGLGGTTAQTHTIGEPVRMNVSAETIQEISDAVDQIVAAGAQNASTTTKGLVEEGTDAQIAADTDTGETGARLFVPPSKLSTRITAKIAATTNPIVRTYLNAGSPATWTKPAGLKYVIVEVQAGGGAGGDANASGLNTVSSGGGGGGGGYSRKLIAVGTLGATETVTTGAGGASSSFGAHATATAGATATNEGAGGSGGIGSSGDINIRGGGGGTGQADSPQATEIAQGGTGGSSMLGGGGAGITNFGNGNTGGVYGGGGGGAASLYPNGAQTGGAGAAGIVIVTEYYA